ncbi:hypothetical protein M407DRAFT_32094 [Tulasnella calospora MUT 4182]|uniref:Uncharacterized protein n=1 Tax=Tulasnella calospora MUT 4182 TaxID=1051891 RepID=A0A0C3PTW9_9AGAM|nr:hypothetical protein M407DRAFT_32094 [Tulasnella calospora MUT 4182]
MTRFSAPSRADGRRNDPTTRVPSPIQHAKAPSAEETQGPNHPPPNQSHRITTAVLSYLVEGAKSVGRSVGRFLVKVRLRLGGTEPGEESRQNVATTGEDVHNDTITRHTYDVVEGVPKPEVSKLGNGEGSAKE